MTKRVMAIAADTWACGKFRIFEPYRNLAKNNGKGKIDFDVFLRGEIDCLDNIWDLVRHLATNYDAVVFQRVGDVRLLNVMLELKHNYGKKIYLEIDDLLFNVHPSSPAYKTWHVDGNPSKIFKEALRLADCVHVSTPELIEDYAEYNNNFEVFGNALDLDSDAFDPEKSRRSELPMDKVIALWTGSSTHIDSLREIAREIRPVFQRRSNSAFALCSNIEFMKFFDIRKDQKIYIPHVPIEEYTSIPSMGDIGLAPVALNEFNDAKSELKCLEYGIWGLPTVCSAAAPYRRFHEISGGANILVENNSPRQWNDAIGKLIDDADLRMELGAKSRKTILEHYNLNLVNKKRLEFFERELGV